MFHLLLLGLPHQERQLHVTPSTGICSESEIASYVAQIAAQEPSCYNTLVSAIAGADISEIALCTCYLHLPWEVGSNMKCFSDADASHTLGYDYVDCAVSFGVAPPAPPCVCEESWTAPECPGQTLSGCPAETCAESVHRPSSSYAPWCKHQDGICAEDMYGSSVGWGYSDCTPPGPAKWKWAFRSNSSGWGWKWLSSRWGFGRGSFGWGWFKV